MMVSVIIPTMNRLESVLRCLDSVLDSNFKNIEIIVVDNASVDSVCNDLELYKNKNKNFHIIYSKDNLGAGGGRNLGAKKAKGKYLLFLDDDNVIDKSMISNLINIFESDYSQEYVMLGPIMLYLSEPKKIWMKYININMYTSQAISKGNKDNYIPGSRILETGTLPNCFMLRSKEFKLVNGFDEKFIVMYEESDLAYRLKNKFKRKIAVVENAITYHDVDFCSKSLSGTCQTNIRSYLTARNRVYFMRKNTSILQVCVFALIFFPLVTIMYLFSFLKYGQFKKSYYFLKGSIKGWCI